MKNKDLKKNKIKVNKRWNLKLKLKIKNKERRGSDSEQKMRCFKIPLCRIFVWKVRDYSVRWTRVGVISGQKMGYELTVSGIREYTKVPW